MAEWLSTRNSPGAHASLPLTSRRGPSEQAKRVTKLFRSPFRDNLDDRSPRDHHSDPVSGSVTRRLRDRDPEIGRRHVVALYRDQALPLQVPRRHAVERLTLREDGPSVTYRQQEEEVRSEDVQVVFGYRKHGASLSDGSDTCHSHKPGPFGRPLKGPGSPLRLLAKPAGSSELPL